MSASARAASERPRNVGRRHTKYTKGGRRQQEAAEQYTIHVRWAFTGEALTTFTCPDIANAGILYSMLSHLIKVSPDRLSMQVGDVFVPQSTQRSVMSVAGFNREVNASCVVLEPKCCSYCEERPHSTKGTFVKGGVPFSYLYQPPVCEWGQKPPVECSCHGVANEWGYRAIRSWFHLSAEVCKRLQTQRLQTQLQTQLVAQRRSMLEIDP